MCESHRNLGIAEERTRRPRRQARKPRQVTQRAQTPKEVPIIKRRKSRVIAPTPVQAAQTKKDNPELKALIEKLNGEEEELPFGKIFRKERVKWRGNAMRVLESTSGVSLPEGRNGRFHAQELSEARKQLKKVLAEAGIDITLPQFIEGAE